MADDFTYNSENPRFVTAGEVMEQQNYNYYSEIWTWTVKTTDAGTSGQVGVNTTEWNTATFINIADQAADNRDMSVVLSVLFMPGNHIYLQHKTDGMRYALYLITGPAVDKDAWWQFPVTYQKSAGAIFGGNTSVVVTIFTTLIPLP